MTFQVITGPYNRVIAECDTREAARKALEEHSAKSDEHGSYEIKEVASSNTALQMFPVLETTGAVYDKWREIEAGTAALSDWDKALLTAIEKALDAGIVYNREMDKFVGEIIPTSPESRELGKGRVEGGCWGYEIYHARKFVEAQREAALDAACIVNFKQGARVGAFSTGGHNFSSATVESLVDGKVKLTATKRGSRNKYQVTIAARKLQSEIDFHKQLAGLKSGSKKAEPAT